MSVIDFRYRPSARQPASYNILAAVAINDIRIASAPDRLNRKRRRSNGANTDRIDEHHLAGRSGVEPMLDLMPCRFLFLRDLATCLDRTVRLSRQNQRAEFNLSK